MKRKSESGVLVIEASIVVTVVMMFISVMLYLTMIFYQQSLVTIMANQTASNIAQIYGNTLRDSFTGYIEADNIYETVTYTNMRNDAYLDVIEQKANAASLYRLKSSRILNTGDSSVEVDIVNKNNELLKSQIVVTIHDTYNVPLASFFGATGALEFEATGRADCVDLLEYMGGVPAFGTTDGNAVAFSDNECTVNFYKHFGDDRPIKTVTVLRGYSINSSRDRSHSQMPGNPTQEKMRFVGWRTEDKRTFNGNTIVNSDTNLYGCWECTITLNPDGGKVEDSTKSLKLIGIVGETIDLPDAERDKCNFAGWYTKKDGEGTEYFDSTIIEGDITLYAKWTCTVSLDSDGGTVTPDSLEVIYGKKLPTLPKPTREGCTFDGWYEEKYGEGASCGSTTVIKGHLTIYAKWVCTVTLNAEGGSINPNSIQAVAGKTVKLSNPTRAHNTFNGWFDNNGKQYTSDTKIKKNIELHARWTCNHEYNRWQSRQGTCVQNSEFTLQCKYCGYSYKEQGARGNHNYAANCGVRHDFGYTTEWKTTYYHDMTHDVSWAGCSVCIHCHAHDTDLCGTHFDLYGFGGWNSFRQVIQIHGYRNLY